MHSRLATSLMHSWLHKHLDSTPQLATTVRINKLKCHATGIHAKFDRNQNTGNPNKAFLSSCLKGQVPAFFFSMKIKFYGKCQPYNQNIFSCYLGKTAYHKFFHWLHEVCMGFSQQWSEHYYISSWFCLKAFLKRIHHSLFVLLTAWFFFFLQTQHFFKKLPKFRLHHMSCYLNFTTTSLRKDSEVV